MVIMFIRHLEKILSSFEFSHFFNFFFEKFSKFQKNVFFGDAQNDKKKVFSDFNFTEA